MTLSSPFKGIDASAWQNKARQLIDSHPLKPAEIVEVVLVAWNAIFDSQIGPKGFRIGTHMFPKPQIMAFFLHELIPLEFASRYPRRWRGDASGGDKDLVHVPDSRLSVEIKTSSHPKSIFGNRSYAQPSTESKKDKSGYYLMINFGKFTSGGTTPKIHLIRFGWIDHGDWIGQKAATGQQAHLPQEVEQGKLVTLFPVEK